MKCSAPYQDGRDLRNDARDINILEDQAGVNEIDGGCRHCARLDIQRQRSKTREAGLIPLECLRRISGIYVNCENPLSHHRIYLIEPVPTCAPENDQRAWSVSGQSCTEEL